MVNFGIFGKDNKGFGTGLGVIADIAMISIEETATSLVYAFINTREFGVALAYSSMGAKMDASPLLYHVLPGYTDKLKIEFQRAEITASLLHIQGMENVEIKVDTNFVKPEDIDKAIFFGGSRCYDFSKYGGINVNPFKSGINIIDSETLKALITKGVFKDVKKGYLFSDDYKTAQTLLGWKLNGEPKSKTLGIHSSKNKPVKVILMPSEISSKIPAKTDELIKVLSSKDIFLFEKTVLQFITELEEIGTLLVLQQAMEKCESVTIDLNQIKDVTVAELFALSMCRKDDNRGYSTALNVLSRIGTKRSVPTLINLLQDKTDNIYGWGGAEFRKSIVYALGKIGAHDDSAELPVRKALESFSDPDASVRREATEAISRGLFERAERQDKFGHLSEASKYYRDFLSSAPTQWSGYIETARNRMQEIEKSKN